MSQFLPEYPEMEMAIWLTSNATQNGIGHLVEGDIVDVREPWYLTSIKVARVAMWLRVEGFEREMFFHLKDPLYNLSHPDPLVEIDTSDPTIITLEKRRYCIPLSNFAQYVNQFDMNRALDISDAYQPFIIESLVEPNVCLYVLPNAPLDLDGLIFDKLTQEYIYG